MKKTSYKIPSLSKKKLFSLEKKANIIRQDILKMLYEAGSGHPAGALGLADIFSALYFHILNHDPKNPQKKDRDRLFLSCGHTAPVRYAAMAEAGYFPKSELNTLRKLESRLQGHPEITRMPGLENTSGPLGDGAAQSTGAAITAKINRQSWLTYCVISDGELQSGIVWESALFAAKYKLDNLVWIIDRNNIQIDGYTSEVMPIEPLHDKFASFNFYVIEIDGHNIAEFIDACRLTETIKEQPAVIIAHTIPGKGVSFMENNPAWHGKPPQSKAQLNKALQDLKIID